ncbi:Mis12 protein-domain-containing protein [Corynascus novoguineensis]|uniref:Mis12 protein-domain-containing protein n=1 Tax=Corynascus novoguineensis TaxID=1126955 RepID=A0AAN7CU35_9PEZI|nr:Mis12 protein-domain-containing protein [Corynascus novoguineensis]
MASRSDTELLTEHFGYPPVSLLDEIINSVNFLAERALHSIEQGLLNAPPASLGFRPPSSFRQQHADEQQQQEEAALARQRHRDEVESGTHQLETLLWASIDKNFDRFEIYVMRNILCLRQAEMDWLRLGHYDGLVFSPDVAGTGRGSGGATGGEENDNDDDKGLSVESVNGLRRRLQASQRLNCMLVAERARNAALLGEMRRLVGVLPGQGGVKVEPASAPASAGAAAGEDGQQQNPPFKFLHDKGDLTLGDAETPLTTTTAFSLSQLQALRELSTALRAVMAGLAAGEEVEEDDQEEKDEKRKKKSWRRERLEYVETATKKHLEHVRGLELGDDGEVRDGEWDGGGRSLARGEVESLEMVASMLGGSREDHQDQDRMDES